MPVHPRAARARTRQGRAGLCDNGGAVALPIPARLHFPPVWPRVGADDSADGANHARAEGADKHGGQGHRSEGAGRLIIEDLTAKARSNCRHVQPCLESVASEASWSSYQSFLFAALRPPDARRSENGDGQIPLDRLL